MTKDYCYNLDFDDIKVCELYLPREVKIASHLGNDKDGNLLGSGSFGKVLAMTTDKRDGCVRFLSLHIRPNNSFVIQYAVKVPKRNPKIWNVSD